MRLQFIVVWIIFFSLISTPLAGQQIHAKFTVEGDIILLRWYPADLETMRHLVNQGIFIDRINIGTTGTNQIKSKLHQVGPVKRDSATFTEAFHNEHPATELLDSALVIKKMKFQDIGSMHLQQKETDRLLMFSMLAIQQDLNLAMSYGMAFRDSVSEPGAVFLYKMYTSISDRNDTVYLIVNTTEETRPSVPPPPVVSASGRYVRIVCNAEKMYPDYFSFYLERSADSGINYQRLNELPILTGIFTGEEGSNYFLDTISSDGRSYCYRIIPQDYFLKQGPASGASCIGLAEHSDAYPTNVEGNLLTDSLVISWEFESSEESRISGFRLYRADSIHGFQFRVPLAVISPTTREALIPPVSGYYYVSVLSKDSSENMSLPELVQVVDTIGPKVPEIIIANMDSNGRVKLVCRNSGDPDLLGYQWYGSNSRSAEFLNLSSSWKKDTVFMDTLDLTWLRDSVYYSLVAADNRYNESVRSTVIALSVPVRAKPDAPLVSKVEQDSGMLKIYWISSQARDVNQYQLYRKKDSADWLLMGIIDKNEKPILEFPEETGVGIFQYAMEAMSNSGKRSGLSPPVAIQVARQPFLPPLKFKALWEDTAIHRVFFEWELPAYPVHHFRILQTKNSKVSTLAMVQGTRTECSVRFTQPFAEVKFYIIAYTKDGRRSIP